MFTSPVSGIIIAFLIHTQYFGRRLSRHHIFHREITVLFRIVAFAPQSASNSFQSDSPRRPLRDQRFGLTSVRYFLYSARRRSNPPGSIASGGFTRCTIISTVSARGRAAYPVAHSRHQRLGRIDHALPLHIHDALRSAGQSQRHSFPSRSASITTPGDSCPAFANKVRQGAVTAFIRIP